MDPPCGFFGGVGVIECALHMVLLKVLPDLLLPSVIVSFSPFPFSGC